MVEIIEEIKKVAIADATVLLQGETGTGKEMAARMIHSYSDRKDKPFIDINCGALPFNLVESELFGFEKSAFTGAASAKKGLFELADGGIIFLDEIGELAQDIQVKLLRFLENRTFKRVGGTKDIFVDVRIIAASNKDLKQLVEERKFRADLFYRLNVVPLHMPPLRERKEDIVLMAETFLKNFSRTLGKKIKGIDPKLKEVLKEYPWPGNVRELKNLLERMVILSGDQQETLVVEQLPKDFFKRPDRAGTEKINPATAKYDYQEGLSRVEKHLEEMMAKSELENGKIVLDDILSGIEKKYIGWALKKTRWNISKAADLLGMNRFTLKRKMEQYFPDEQY
ncbi:MAG: sigma-54 dependent transcriptional regulator [Bacillota bacterium]|nr:sigma-54 dependent transcriptional regulator [Bacillota bacterium]